MTGGDRETIMSHHLSVVSAEWLYWTKVQPDQLTNQINIFGSSLQIFLEKVMLDKSLISWD